MSHVASPFRRAVLVVCALSSLPASANGAFETYGPSNRARAMANAAVAVDDVAAAHTNPAAVGRAPGMLAFHAGFTLDVPALSVDLEQKPAPGSPLAPAMPAPVPGLQFGFTIPLDLVFQDRVFIGGSFYFPTQVLVRARSHDPQRPSFYLYDSATEHFDISVAVGVKLLEWLYLGGGARIAAGQSGTVDLAVDPVRSRLSQQSINTYQYPTASPTVGLLIGRFGLDDTVEASIGVVFRDEAAFRVVFPARLLIEGADVDTVLDIGALANYTPRSLTSGLSLEILRSVIVDAEVQAAFWSRAPPPYVVTRVDLGGAGLDALGLEDGLDAPGPGQERAGNPGLVDTANLRVGVEANLFEELLALRGGYQYRPTPVPDQTTGTNLIDCNAHILSAGFGVRFAWPAVFARPIEVDAAYQAQILEPRSAEKASPIDEVGDWTAGGVVHALSVGWVYRF